MAKPTEKILDIAAEGEFVLFLGAGAIYGSTIGDQNNPALMGNDLRDKLHALYFPSEGKTNATLKRVCSSIQNIKGQSKLREALFDFLIPVNPSQALLEIPKMRWKAIYTVNVDDAVERAYEQTEERVQKLFPIVLADDISAKDPMCEVNLYKLHGCLRNYDSKLIFSHKDYTSAREANLRMFASLVRDLSDSPFIFIGFSFEDDDFQDLWQSVLDYIGNVKRKAPTFVVSPGATPSLIESMEVEGLTVIDSGVSEFFPWLRANMPKRAKSATLQVHERIAHLQSMIQSEYGKTIDDEILDPINTNFDIVKKLPAPNRDPNASRFLLGAYPSWADILQGLTIKRDVEDDLIADFHRWLSKVSFRATLVCGGAGYGKSTFILQIAELVSQSFGNVEVLVKKESGDLHVNSLIEYVRCIGVPVVVVVDDAFRFTGALRKLQVESEQNALPMYVLAASRPADWNSSRKANGFDIANRLDIPRLSKDESFELAKTVKKFGKLRSDFESSSLDDLTDHFFEKSEKHLLAGLMTATIEGVNDFDDVIQDEYFRIQTDVARNLYLNVCLTHSLGLPMPASLACASVGISIVDFHPAVSDELDEIIIETLDNVSKDLNFKSQHRVIAETVIKKFIRPDTAVDLLVGLARFLNPHHQNEYAILVRLYDETFLKDILGLAATVRSCYEQFIEVFPSDSFIKQHYAIFESHEKNFNKAHRLIDEALHARPRDNYFLNTKANILLREAAVEGNKSRAEKLFLDGTKLLRERIEKDYNKEVHYLSLIERQLDWAKRSDLTSEQRLNILQEAESDVAQARRRYPASSEISTDAAKILLSLRNIPDAKAMLVKSVKLDGANTRARLLLSRVIIEEKKYQDALVIVDGGLVNDPKNSGLLKLRLQCMKELDASWPALRKAYLDYLVTSDKDIYERILLIKGLIEHGDLAGSAKHMDRLRKSDTSFGVKKNLKFSLIVQEQPMVVEGEYQATGFGKGFVKISGYPRILDAHIDMHSLSAKKSLSNGRRIKAEIGINGFGLYVRKLL